MLRDLGMTWTEFMKTRPAFAVGDTFIYRSKSQDHDGYTVAVYEMYDEQTGAADICRKGIFWDYALALAFALQFSK